MAFSPPPYKTEEIEKQYYDIPQDEHLKARLLYFDLKKKYSTLTDMLTEVLTGKRLQRRAYSSKHSMNSTFLLFSMLGITLPL